MFYYSLYADDIFLDKKSISYDKNKPIEYTLSMIAFYIDNLSLPRDFEKLHLKFEFIGDNNNKIKKTLTINYHEEYSNIRLFSIKKK